MTEPTTDGRRSRRDVLRYGAVAAGIAWAAPVITTLDVPAAAVSSTACCHGNGGGGDDNVAKDDSEGCGFSSFSFVLFDAAGNCYKVKYDSDGVFTCGKGAHPGDPCKDLWSTGNGCANDSDTCPSGLSASTDPVNGVTISYPDTLRPTFYVTHQGQCCVSGTAGTVTGVKTGKVTCTYSVGKKSGSITFPYAPNKC